MKRLFICLATVLLSSAVSLAQDWPSKPVRVVVPFAAGGAADTLARVFAEQLSTAFGKQFYVENRGGGGSVIGTETVARAEPDGHTFGLSGMATHVLAPAMNRNAAFDPNRDFTHVAYFGGAPNIFVVHPTFGPKSVKDFIAHAKSAKNGVEYVSPGIGSVGNLVAEFLAAKEGIKVVHVPHRGGAGAIFDLVAGHVKVGMMSFSTAREHVRSRALIPLAVSSAERIADLPNVPTLKELGYPDLVATTWWSLSGPARVPKAIVDKVNAEVIKSLDRPQVQKQLAQEAVQTRAMTPAEVAQFMRSEVDKWAPFARTVTAK